MTIYVGKRDGSYEANVDGNPCLWGRRKTRNEAIGHLVFRLIDMFSIEAIVETTDKPESEDT